MPDPTPLTSAVNAYVAAVQAEADAASQALATAQSALSSSRVDLSSAQARITTLSADVVRLHVALTQVQSDFDAYRAAHPGDTVEPPQALLPGVGGYNGGPSETPDENHLKWFGFTPDVASTYYQSNQSVNVAYETARVKRGTSPNLTMTTKGTQYLAQIAAGNTAALAWLNKYIDGLVAVAKVNPDIVVFGSLEHEAKSKVAAGARGEVGLTGESADPVVIGRAQSVFFRLLRARGQANLLSTYWMVGYDRAFEGAEGNAFTDLPDVITWDPYGRGTTATIASVAKADAQWIMSQSWFTGQPLAITETGLPVANGDDAVARYLTDFPETLAGLGRELGVTFLFAILFNRTKDNDHQIAGRADGQAFPKAVAAFSASGKR